MSNTTWRNDAAGPARRTRALLALAAAVLLGAEAAAAAGVTITPLLRQRETLCLLEVDGQVFAGLDGGGLAVFPAADPSAVEVWTAAGGGLSGNYVRGLAWTGRNLWVATTGAGMTRIGDLGGTPTYRPYVGNLAGLDVTAVAGAVVGDAERVWYAAAGAGVGVITNGISVATYTADRDGLISDDVRAITLHDGAVWFGTAVGVSRFADNVFTDANAGLGNLFVDDLAVGPDGVLYAAGRGGAVYAWDPEGGAWVALGSAGYWIERLAWVDDDLHVLGQVGGEARIARWTGTEFVVTPAPYAAAHALAGGADLWVGGRLRLEGMGNASGIAWYARADGAGGWDEWRLDGAPLVGTVEGVTFGADGRAWIGSWAGQGISGLRDGQWTDVYELAAAGNDSSGLINHSGNVLAMATGTDGAIWAVQFASGGLLRHDPASGRTEPVVPANSGLDGRRIVNLVVHPAGPLLMMHDSGDETKVQVLVDPARWRDPGNWIVLPPGSDGLGDGSAVWDAYVERADVIWFAVAEAGLVRWDVNGDAAGPDDPLTWFDAGDDRWDPPVAAFGGWSNDPAKAMALAPGPDGSIWCGGDGLVRFVYDEATAAIPFGGVLDVLVTKQSPDVPGLLGGGVADLAVDGDGHLWVLTRNGLNRVRGTGPDLETDAWLDLMNYAGSTVYGTLYSPSVIAPLPGFLYRKLVAEPGGRRLLVGADRGAALVATVPGGGDGTTSSLAGVHLYPSPWRPEAGPLAIGGLPATADDPAEVGIYTVEGQLVYRDPYVAGDEGFWSGVNRVGSPVSTGLYVVRISWRGTTELRTLAVVR